MLIWQNVGDLRLSEILPWCLEIGGVDTILLSNRQSFDKSGKGEYEAAVDPYTKEIFGQNLIACFQARGWPGTKLINHKGRVYVSNFDAGIALTISKIEDSLFNWLNVSGKALPEDICLFKRGAQVPVFISVTHERDAWVVAENCPRGFTASSCRPEDLYIWPGKYFCRI
jgi:hypothetical protein